MRIRVATGLPGLLLALAACGSAPERRPALGQAYIGPMELELRQQLAARAPVVEKLRHGDRVEIIARRRRFYQIRTAKGSEGWVDGRQLLAPPELDQLRRLAGRAARAPSQGRATVLDPLNVHTAPYRQAPSFRRIEPGKHADVIAYERVPRRPYEPQPLIAARAAGGGAQGEARQAARKRGGKPPIEPLAPVPAPPLPPNWLDLSRTALPQQESPAEKQAASPPGPAAAPATDEWALVRLADGTAGWVLARMLYMDIPDEVAQYAERARIAACFRLGAVRSGAGEKAVWLWAAQSQRMADFDFDSLRIFVWSARRQRYETSFIERNLKGWLPLELRQDGGGVRGFEVVVEEKNGALVRRQYAIQPGLYRARVVARTPAARPASWLEDRGAAAPPAAEAADEPGWRERLRGWIGGIRRRISR